jgi:hypothetical protein
MSNTFIPGSIFVLDCVLKLISETNASPLEAAYQRLQKSNKPYNIPYAISSSYGTAAASCVIFLTLQPAMATAMTASLSYRPTTLSPGPAMRRTPTRASLSAYAKAITAGRSGMKKNTRRWYEHSSAQNALHCENGVKRIVGVHAGERGRQLRRPLLIRSIYQSPIMAVPKTNMPPKTSVDHS